MRKLINRVGDVVREQTEGFTASHPELLLNVDPIYVVRAGAPVAGKSSFDLAGTDAEFGGSTHGEPGIDRSAFHGPDGLVDKVFAEQTAPAGYCRKPRRWNPDRSGWDGIPETAIVLTADARLGVVINGLGDTALSELHGVAGGYRLSPSGAIRNCTCASQQLMRVSRHAGLFRDGPAGRR